jgi:hypothetical protein
VLSQVINKVHLIELNSSHRFFSKNVINMTDLSICNLTIGPLEFRQRIKGPHTKERERDRSYNGCKPYRKYKC